MASERKGEPESSVTRRGLFGALVGGASAFLAGCRSDDGGADTAAEWNELQSKIAGVVLPRDAKAYESTRASMLWNARKPNRFPEALVHVRSEADVREVVRFAHRTGRKVAVRGGGHSWCGSPLRDGGILIDLSRLRSVHFDVARRTAVAEPAATNRELVAQLSPHGLAFPVGHCPTVSLSGYVLSGGFGWNSGAWGPACASVESIDVVNARGESVRASERENADLFWAARGAGPGFFGVVTRYHLRLQPLPKAIRTSTVIYPFDEAERMAEWLPTIAAALPPQVELNCLVGVQPAGSRSGVDAVPRRRIVVTATAFADTEANAKRWLEPLASAPPSTNAILDLGRESTMASLLDGFGEFFPENHRYAVDTAWSTEPAAAMFLRLRDRVAASPSPKSFVLFVPIPPPPADAPPPPDMALSMFAPAFAGIYGIWTDAASDSENEAWVRDVMRSLEPQTIGHYVGETDLAADAHRATRSFSVECWKRLQDVREKYDPDRVFHAYLGPS